MGKWFFNFYSGDMGFATTDNLGISADGDLLMRMGDNMVMNMETGDLDIISGWPEEDLSSSLFDNEE